MTKAVCCDGYRVCIEVSSEGMTGAGWGHRILLNVFFLFLKEITHMNLKKIGLWEECDGGVSLSH